MNTLTSPALPLLPTSLFNQVKARGPLTPEQEEAFADAAKPSPEEIARRQSALRAMQTPPFDQNTAIRRACLRDGLSSG